MPGGRLSPSVSEADLHNPCESLRHEVLHIVMLDSISSLQHEVLHNVMVKSIFYVT